MFVNGDLKGKFIMDRNLGARDPNRWADGTGMLVYEFGRNSPFATNGTSYGTNAYLGAGGDEDKWTVKVSDGTTTVATAVNNPMIYYKPGVGLNWCEAVDSVTYLWQDYENDAEGGGKSIFDPSPKGWKVGHSDTWSNFTSENTTWVSSGDIGRNYALDGDNYAYYPCYGYRSGAGQYYELTTQSFYWSSTPATSARAFGFSIRPAIFYQTDIGRATGLHVRAVQHDE